MSSITIRLATPQDYAVWLALWQQYQAFYEVTVAPEVCAETWRRLLEPAEPMHVMLAEQSGEVVGFAHVIEHRSCWTSGNYAYLQDLFTRADRRGQGVGLALIEYLYAWAEARGCSRVYWLTQEDNHTARRLYDRVAERPGFIQYRKALPVR